MKKNFKKWTALFLSVAMVAVSGVTTNTSFHAAEDTGVQESAADSDTETGTAADATSATSATSATGENGTEATQEVALTQDGTDETAEAADATASSASSEESKTEDNAENAGTKAVSSESVASSSEIVSSSSEKDLTAEEKIQKDLDDSEKTVYSYEDSHISVTATLTDPKAVPDSARFVVTPVTQNSTAYNYDAYMDALNKDADAEADEPVYTDENTLLYDMAFYYDEPQEDGSTKEVEFEPVDGSVQIAAEFKKDQLTKDIAAENDEDVEVTHLPLTDEVKDSVDTTAKATNISTDDVKVENVQSANVSVDGTQTAEFSTASFSVFAIHTDPAINAVRISDIDLQTALGAGYDYGIIANKYKQYGDTETNVMVGSYSSSAAEVGASNNYSNAGGNNYIGSFDKDTVMPIRFHQAPENIYLGEDAWNEYKAGKINFDQAHIKGTNIQIDITTDVKNIIKTIGNNFNGYVPENLPAEMTYDENNQTTQLKLNFKNKDSGTYLVKFTGNTFSVGDHSKNINILKNSNQTIVFYCTSSDLTIYDYAVNGNNIGSLKADQSPDADSLIQQVIFYAPNAKSLNLPGDGTCGIFIAPNATFTKGNTSAGILVCNDYEGGNGEWHYHNHNLPAPGEAEFKLTAKKKYNGGNLIGGDFSFSLYSANNQFITDGSAIQTKNNDGSGNIEFDNISYNKEGTYYYVLKENNDKQEGVTYDDSEYDITIEVEKNAAQNKYELKNKTIVKKSKNSEKELSNGEVPEFNNSTTVKSAHVTLGGNKTFENYPSGIQNPVFTYTLKETTEGAEYTDTATTTGAGKYAFKPIEYTKTGT
ncbi:MAG: FctA domain-containing protein, partial [Eubacteriales bacterium]